MHHRALSLRPLVPLTFLLAACASPPKPVAPAAAPTATQAPEATPLSKAGRATADAPQPRKTLTIRARDVRRDGSDVLFEPDHAVQRAHYEVYRFAAADFDAHVGGKDPVTVTVAVERIEDHRVQPGPDSPSPEGGIGRTEYHVHTVQE